jgi:hypothetical protein
MGVSVRHTQVLVQDAHHGYQRTRNPRSAYSCAHPGREGASSKNQRAVIAAAKARRRKTTAVKTIKRKAS